MRSWCVTYDFGAGLPIDGSIPTYTSIGVELEFQDERLKRIKHFIGAEQDLSGVQVAQVRWLSR